jgi:hypothetical protein
MKPLLWTLVLTAALFLACRGLFGGWTTRHLPALTVRE